MSRPLTQDEIKGNSDINITDLPKGMYFLHAFHEETSFNKILIKQ
jgi:hypothetical protein